LLLEARLLLRRGQPDQAQARCENALEIAPQSWEAHVMVGDILTAEGRPEEALERYREAQAIVPEQAGVEERIARAVLARAERDRLGPDGDAAAIGAGAAPGPRRNPQLAAVLSLVLPGLGQGYNRQLLKAAIILGMVVVLVMALFFQVGAQLRQLAQQGGARASLDYWDAVLTPGAMLWSGLLMAAWFYSIVDAALAAGRPPGRRRDLI
jgi:tetratricopeptide (TPR) repeat protein